VFGQSVPSYVPTNGLVGWWGFNGNAQDGSGNGNHGTVNGATLTTDRFGNQNGTYSFDGVDDFISVPTLTNLIHNVQFLTINCNLNSISGGVIFGNWISNSSPSGPIGFFFGITSDNRISISTVGGLQIYSVDTFGFLSSNQWNNLILVYDGTQTENTNRIKIYINNINYPFNFSHTIPTYLGNQSNTTFFGARGANHAGLSIAGFYDGKLDDIGIWNRALTQQEITNLYNSQLPTQTSLCLPSITTNAPNSIGIDSVIVGGNITNNGGSSIVLRGVCYSTTPNPNMGNMRTEDGSGVGSFSTILRNLNPSTTYYVRSYAKNTNGVVVYGDEVSFSTGTPIPSFLCGTTTVTDVDGNSYNTVQIGNQCWTQSNLKVSKYRNGDSIPNVYNDLNWASLTYGAYCVLENNQIYNGVYGKLYNHFAVMDVRGICPTGWHVPSDFEWKILIRHLDASADTLCNVPYGHGCVPSTIAGGMLRNVAVSGNLGVSGWGHPNAGATNSSGFNALPGGWRHNTNGAFIGTTDMAYWWSYKLINAPSILLMSNTASIYLSQNEDYVLKTNGNYVRCLKD
jgi:uncharacterized protein (TIGR02145 family)